MKLEEFVWTREPEHYVIDGDILRITTSPHTDLWQRTYYDKTRRIERGLFKSNSGILINADINAAYQMMKLGEARAIPIKTGEQIIKIKVA